MNWISVKDQWPENFDEVLLYHPFNVGKDKRFIIFVGYFDLENKEWVCGWAGMIPACAGNDYFTLKKSKVTHWSYLPKPPKKVLQ